MRIAILNDIPGDRQQLERLFKRIQEKDHDVLIETFGAAEALIPVCERFDLFFLDIIPVDGFTSLNVFHVIRNKGVNKPVYITSNDEVMQQAELSDNLFYIEKPYIDKDIFNLVAKYLPKLSEPQTPPGKVKKAPSISPSELLYITEIEGHVSCVLTECRSTAHGGTFKKFLPNLKKLPNMVLVKSNLAVNPMRIKSFTPISIKMENDVVFLLPPWKINELKAFKNKNQ